MSAYVGEIRLFGGNFPPAGWAFCDGQLLSISENEELFTLIGTTYGGDGQETFALPDLRGRVAVGSGDGPDSRPRTIGESAGVEEVTVTAAQMPSHNHRARASSATSVASNPSHKVPAAGGDYAPAPDSTYMDTSSLGFAGGSQAHNNMAPFLPVSFIIALHGVYPSPS